MYCIINECYTDHFWISVWVLAIYISDDYSQALMRQMIQSH